MDEVMSFDRLQRVSAKDAARELVEVAYVDHYRDVYRYVLGLTRSAADADEISAEVFVRALRSWTSAPERVLPWLLLTARRIATDRVRRAIRLGRALTRLQREPAVRTSEGLDFWLWFDAASNVLTARQREVLVLRFEADLTDADIGEIMGLSESGVRSLVARAIDGLRAHPEVL